MPSSSISVKCGKSLAEIVGHRWQQLGYRSVSAYLKGLARYDAMVSGDHSVTLPLSHLTDAEQDRIDAQLLDVVKRGVGQRGQLLKRLIEMVREAGAEPTGHAIADTIRKKSTKSPRP